MMGSKPPNVFRRLFLKVIIVMQNYTAKRDANARTNAPPAERAHLERVGGPARVD